MLPLALKNAHETAAGPASFVKGFWWVPTVPGESHGVACQRVGLLPTETIVSITWSLGLLKLVAESLGRRLTKKNGLAGCCAPAMYCGPKLCWTHSSGGESFSNFGRFLGLEADAGSVYTCRNASFTLPPAANDSSPPSSSETTALLPPTPPPSLPLPLPPAEGPPPPLDPIITAVVPTTVDVGARVTVSGTNFGLDAAAVRVMLGDADCGAVEVCGRVCRPCDEEGKCGLGELCLRDTSDEYGL
ncbi:unnamed protein product, partial [Phaeothamnion confervicola]